MTLPSRIADTYKPVQDSAVFFRAVATLTKGPLLFNLKLNACQGTLDTISNSAMCLAGLPYTATFIFQLTPLDFSRQFSGHQSLNTRPIIPH